MGNSFYPKSEFQVLNIPDDIVLRELKSFGYYVLVDNPITSQKYQRYGVYTKENKSLEEELKIYEFRKKQDLNLVKVHFVQLMEETYFCVGRHQMKVYTQHIQLFLKDLYNIPLDVGLYIMQAALIGFQIIYDNFGYINLNDQMFGVDQQKKVKVWLNSNFSLNNCQNQLHFSPEISKNPEQIMVEEIFEIIEDHISNSNFLIKFKNQRILDHKNLSFLDAKQFINNFASKYKIIIPSKLQFVKQKINHPINYKYTDMHKRYVQSHRHVHQNLKQLVRIPQNNGQLKNRNGYISNINLVSLNIPNSHLHNNQNQNTYLKPHATQTNHIPVAKMKTPTAKLKTFYLNHQKNSNNIRSQSNLFAHSQIQKKQDSQIFIKKPSSFINNSIKTLAVNRFPCKTQLLNSYLINNEKSIEASTIAENPNNKHNLENLNYQNEFICSIQTTEVNLISKNVSEKYIQKRRKQDVEQTGRYFDSMEKNLKTVEQKPILNRYNSTLQNREINQNSNLGNTRKNSIQDLKISKKQKIAQIIANAKLANKSFNKISLYQATSNNDIKKIQEPEQEESNFFKANFLDYEKYKQLLKQGNNSGLKQSITFAELGNNIPIPIRQNHQGIKLQKLQKLTKRRQISKSLIPDDQFYYQSQYKPLQKNRNESIIQFYESNQLDH